MLRRERLVVEARVALVDQPQRAGDVDRHVPERRTPDRRLGHRAAPYPDVVRRSDQHDPVHCAQSLVDIRRGAAGEPVAGMRYDVGRLVAALARRRRREELVHGASQRIRLRRVEPAGHRGRADPDPHSRTGWRWLPQSPAGPSYTPATWSPQWTHV